MLSKTLTAATVIAAGVAAAHADTILKFQSNRSNDVNSVLISNGKVRMDSSNQGTKETSIYDDQGRTFTVVNPQQKQYVVMDRTSIQEQAKRMKRMQEEVMTQVREQMKNMPPEQRQELEQQMAPFGDGGDAANKPTPKYSTKKTRKTGTLNGVSCVVYKSYRDGRLIGDACIASLDVLGISKGDYKTLRSMFAFMRDMAKEFASATGTSVPQSDMTLFENVNGLPVKMTNVNGDIMTLAGASNQALSPDLFAIPAGYQEAELAGPKGAGQPPGQAR